MTTIKSIKFVGSNHLGGDFEIVLSDGTQLVDNQESLYLIYAEEDCEWEEFNVMAIVGKKWINQF